MTRTLSVRVNRWVDFAERVGWTAIEAASGALLDQLTSGHVGWRAIGYATAVAALKVVVAQNTGQNKLGAITPGVEVLEEKVTSGS